ncbi:MAG: efflux RND transporter periplasmic adaptor subunit [Ktedonobacteraceae bacterium]
MSEVETNLHLQPLFEDEDTDIESADSIDVVPAAPPRRPRRRRGWLIALTVLLLLAVIGAGVFYYMQVNSQTPVHYTQQTVTTGNLSLTVSASGPINPKATYQMNFSAAGQVNKIDVSVGQQVKKGQTLATLHSTSLQDAVTQAQQSVTTAQTAYDDAVNIGASQSVLDNDYNSLLSAQNQLTTAQHNLDATKLTAPANASVASIGGAVGQSVTAGGSTTPFMTLIDTSTLSIASQVNEADITGVQVGQPAHFTVEGYPSRTFRASVATVEGVPSSTSSSTSTSIVTYPVDLAIDQQSLNGAHIYPGMTATTTITTAQRIGVLVISNTALSFSNTAVQAGVISRTALFAAYGGSTSARGSQSNQRIVLELHNGKVTPVLVTVGLTDGTSTEVLSGLQAGDQVIVSATGGSFTNLQTQTTSPGGNAPGGGGGGGRGIRIPGGG